MLWQKTMLKRRCGTVPSDSSWRCCNHSLVATEHIWRHWRNLRAVVAVPDMYYKVEHVVSSTFPPPSPSLHGIQVYSLNESHAKMDTGLGKGFYSILHQYGESIFWIPLLTFEILGFERCEIHWFWLMEVLLLWDWMMRWIHLFFCYYNGTLVREEDGSENNFGE